MGSKPRPLIGYKLLTLEGRSLRSDYSAIEYDLSGAWTDIPGHGSSLGRTVPGLLSGGFAPLLAECQYSHPNGEVHDYEVVTSRRVRVLRHATIDLWTLVRVACRAARLVVPHGDNPCANAAIEAAERCERERTPEAAASAMATVEAAAMASSMASAMAARAAAEAASATAMASWSSAMAMETASMAAWAAASTRPEAIAAMASAEAAWSSQMAMETAALAARAMAPTKPEAEAMAEARTSILGYLLEEAWPAPTTA
jgi:hypothetical protein